MAPPMKRAVVLGAGMSGLATGLRLQELGVRTEIIEQDSIVGGASKSFSWNEFTQLDLGPHIYHTPDKKLEQFWKKEYGDLFYESEFWGKNVKGIHYDEFYDYPLSFESLKHFPHDTRKQILYDLEHLDPQHKARAQNYYEYVLGLVGPTLTKMFFTQYPEKLWGISIHEMTANWAPKRINFRKKNEHFHAGQWSAVGKYGSGAIMERMAQKFVSAGGTLTLNKKITALMFQNSTITTLIANHDQRRSIGYDDYIVSTLPINVIAQLLNKPNTLTFRGAKLVFIAVNKPLCIPGIAQFLYYDDPKIIFHRVSEQKKFCSYGFPEYKTVLVAEIAYTKGDERDQTPDATIAQQTIRDLIRVNLAGEHDIYDTLVLSLPYVYPFLTPETEPELARVRSSLEAFKQLYLIGTGGDFHYADLQILHTKGYDLAERIASGNTEETAELIKGNSIVTFNKKVTLPHHTISAEHPPFIIAEIGLNHNGSITLAQELIDKAYQAGCSAVKFQTYNAASRVSQKVKANRYAEELIDMEESLFTMLSRLELSFEEHKQLFDYARTKGLEVFSTPFDLESVDMLELLNVNVYKISSMDLVNLPLIKKVAQTGKPIIMSTGMSTLGQIEDAVSAVKSARNPNLILLHCVSSYPADPQDMNLNIINTLKTTFNVPVGLSDHTIGLTTCIVALAMGVQVIERHFTLDRTMEGPDHILSSDPDEMRELVRLAHLVPLIQGSREKNILESEVEVLNKFKKCLYAKTDIQKGDTLSLDNITIKGPGGGILPKYLDIIIGKTARIYIEADYPITWDIL